MKVHDLRCFHSRGRQNRQIGKLQTVIINNQKVDMWDQAEAPSIGCQRLAGVSHRTWMVRVHLEKMKFEQTLDSEINKKSFPVINNQLNTEVSKNQSSTSHPPT